MKKRLFQRNTKEARAAARAIGKPFRSRIRTCTFADDETVCEKPNVPGLYVCAKHARAEIKITLTSIREAYAAIAQHQLSLSQQQQYLRLLRQKLKARAA